MYKLANNSDACSLKKLACPDAVYCPYLDVSRYNLHIKHVSIIKRHGGQTRSNTKREPVALQRDF